jgi:hypothetical protein
MFSNPTKTEEARTTLRDPIDDPMEDSDSSSESDGGAWENVAANISIEQAAEDMEADDGGVGSEGETFEEYEVALNDTSDEDIGDDNHDEDDEDDEQVHDEQVHGPSSPRSLTPLDRIDWSQFDISLPALTFRDVKNWGIKRGKHLKYAAKSFTKCADCIDEFAESVLELYDELDQGKYPCLYVWSTVVPWLKFAVLRSRKECGGGLRWPDWFRINDASFRRSQKWTARTVFPYGPTLSAAVWPDEVPSIMALLRHGQPVYEWQFCRPK